MSRSRSRSRSRGAPRQGGIGQGANQDGYVARFKDKGLTLEDWGIKCTIPVISGNTSQKMHYYFSLHTFSRHTFSFSLHILLTVKFLGNINNIY